MVVCTSAEGLRDASFVLPLREGGTLSAYYAAPADKTNIPIILVVQEIFGMNAHIQDICRRFAHEGYFAITVNLFERQGDALRYTDVAELLDEIVSKVKDDQVMADLDDSVTWAAQQGGDARRVGITGFCWGGRIVWMYMAHHAAIKTGVAGPSVKAGVAWYGKLTVGHGPLITHNPIDIVSALHAPVLGLYGAKDSSIPVEDITLMEKALQDNAEAKASQFVVYPDSGHAFFADYRSSYHEADAKDGWQRCIAWFGKYLADRVRL